MKIPNNLNGYKLFSALGIFILGLDFLAIVITLFSIFYWPILAIYLLAGVALLITLFFHNRKKLNWLQITSISLLSFLTILLFSSHAEPSVFSGRDQGSFSEAAVRLAQNHKLQFETSASQEFFKVYGPGTALNFPGFSYTQSGKLITHFSLGYIAWLATFYSLFGLYGLLAANGVLFFFFSLSFFALIRHHSNKRTAWLGLLLALGTFILTWFLKFTLSENLALGFIWFGIFEFSLFLRNRDQLFFFSALMAFSLLAFTRLEAWALLVMLGVILYVIHKKDRTIFSKIKLRNFYWFLGIFLTTYLITLKVNSQFYLSSLKGLLRSFSSGEDGLSIASTLIYLLKIFHYYNVLIFLVIGALGISYLLYRKKYSLLIPFFILLPLCIYLVHPGISTDHPWMLRRFSFAIIPLGIFYTALTANRLFFKKIYFFFLATLLVATNSAFSLPYANFSENQGLLIQVKKLSETFSNTDLVLVDQLASGDGWSMIGAPMSFLYGKQAVYFFNTNDFAKIDLKKFTNTYLIIPDRNIALYENFDLSKKAPPQEEYRLERKYLIVPNLSRDSNFSQELPITFQSETKGKVYLLKQ